MIYLFAGITCGWMKISITILNTSWKEIETICRGCLEEPPKDWYKVFFQLWYLCSSLSAWTRRLVFGNPIMDTIIDPDGHLPWDCIKWQDFRVECSEHLQICSHSGRCFFFEKPDVLINMWWTLKVKVSWIFFSIDIRFKDWLLWLFTLFVPKMGLYQSWKGKEIKLALHRKLKCLLSEFEHVMSGSCQIKDVPLKLNTSQQSMHCCHLSLNLSAR